ncbi:hypothetical protein AAC387_Pa08g0044 [Persea americana]
MAGQSPKYHGIGHGLGARLVFGISHSLSPALAPSVHGSINGLCRLQSVIARHAKLPLLAIIRVGIGVAGDFFGFM